MSNCNQKSNYPSSHKDLKSALTRYYGAGVDVSVGLTAGGGEQPLGQVVFFRRDYADGQSRHPRVLNVGMFASDGA